MFIYSYQQHDHLLPGNDRMLVIGSSALAKNHGHLKSSRLAADTLIFNFPLNHPRLWRQMEHSLSGARYSIILFMWPPLHLSLANGRLMGKPLREEGSWKAPKICFAGFSPFCGNRRAA